MEVEDFHLRDIQQKILSQDTSDRVRCEVLRRGTNTTAACEEMLKCSQLTTTTTTTAVVAYSPAVFVLVKKTNPSTVQIALLSYNEEVLEDVLATVEDSVPVAESLVLHIFNSLNRTWELCLGVGEAAAVAAGALACEKERLPDLTGLLVERYGERIIVRSRTCARIAGDHLKLCAECDQLLGGASIARTVERAATPTTTLPLKTAAEDCDSVGDNDSEDEEDPRDSLDSYMGKSIVNDDDNEEDEEESRQNNNIDDMAVALDRDGGAATGDGCAETAVFFIDSGDGIKFKEEETVTMASAVVDRSSGRTYRSSVASARSCRACARTFISEAALASHVFQEHAGGDVIHNDDEVDRLLERFVKCPLDGCFKAFRSDSSAAMRNHVARSHSGTERGQSTAAETSSGQNECLECGKVFKNVYFWRKHMAGVHDTPSLPCHICGAFIKGQKSLAVHIKAVHNNARYTCPEPNCDVTAKNKDHIKDHIAAVHRKEPRYICSVCGTRYKYRNKWKYCEDKHKGKFLHKCLHCDKQFNEKRKYDLHQRVHTGEKPYTCPICNIRMARIDNLNAHTKKTHGGLTWQEAVARSAAIVAAQQLPSMADAHMQQHQAIAAYELSANGDCLDLKTVVADCFKASGSGVVVLGSGSGGVADFKLLGSPPSPTGSWMT